jgi:multiple sugar transport system permease protein
MSVQSTTTTVPTGSGATALPRRGRGRPARSRSRAAVRRRGILALLGPFAVLFAAFYLVPIGYALYQSFLVTERTGPFAPAQQVWGGLQNYSRIFQDDEFVSSVGRMLLFGAVQVPIMLLIALVLALLLDSVVARLKRGFRLAYFAPYAVPTVIAAIMWGYLYAPSLSPVVDAARTLGLSIDFLGRGTVLWSIANIVTWTYTGYNMLIIFSALQAIPRDLYEAARIDGASGLQIALRVKIPIIAPALILTGVFSIIGTLQLFTEPQVLRNITTSITSTYTPNLFAYTQASANNYTYAAAVSIVLTVVTAVLSFTFLRFTQRRTQA